jgi:cold shock protein
MNEIHRGIVLFYDIGRGFGFIIDNETGHKYFVHNDDLLDRILINNIVEFTTTDKDKRGPRAENVKLIPFDNGNNDKK